MRSKDEGIKQMERIIEEKSNSIAFLLQQKGSLHVKEPMGGSTHAPSSTVLGRLADLKRKLKHKI